MKRKTATSKKGTKYVRGKTGKWIVKPHGRSRKSCRKCGGAHSLSAHHSHRKGVHRRGPRGGSSYRKVRGLA